MPAECAQDLANRLQRVQLRLEAVELEELRAPLTDVQKIAFIEAALLEFDGFEAQLGSLAAVGEVLRALRWHADES